MIPSEVLRDTSEMGPQNTSPLGVASLRFSSIVVQIQIERLGSSNSRSPAPDAPFVQIRPCPHFVHWLIMSLGGATPLRIGSETLRKTSGVGKSRASFKLH